MKIIKTFATLSIVSMLVSCNNDQATKSTNQLTNLQSVEKNSSDITTGVLDSLRKIDSQIVLLRNTQESKMSQIKFLTNKIDSLKNSITQLETTTIKVKTCEIELGINGANKKLKELKAQRESITEQQHLQEQEVALAEKKISLLNDEKEVYDEQRKELWNKGVAPKYFKKVDSLLVDINKSISQQKTRIKDITRSIHDIQEQTESIEQQRMSLSSKIRNNYSAQEIFNDFSEKEKGSITTQIKVLELKLKGLIEEDLDLSNSLAIDKAKKIIFVSEQQQNENQKEILKQQQAKSPNNKVDSVEIKSEIKKRRVIYTVMGLGVLAFILVLYILGKKIKEKN